MEMFIDGSSRASRSGARMAVINPASGEQFDSVPLADADDVEDALASAERAFAVWKATPVETRARLQHRAADVMRSRAEELGALLMRELGRPVVGAIAEVVRAADLIDVYAEEGLRIAAEVPLSGIAGEKTLITREPVGVVVAITPFNNPINLIALKLGAALIAGCTMVAKPSEDTPLTTIRLAELFVEAGYPKGVFNVVTGGRATAEALVMHEIPRKITFTGGVAAGKAIAAAAAATLKRVTLELGGQSPAIVCKDANLDRAAASLARHGFANSGQFCYRAARVYVEREVYEPLIEKLVERASSLGVGAPKTGAALGPLVNEKIFRNCERHVLEAKAKGARIVLGGHRLTGEGFDGGWYFPPTIVADADASMLIMNEETFGPAIAVAPFDSREEALAAANATRFGLAAFVFTADLGVGLAMAERLEAGSVWVNDIRRSSPFAPFGGVKQSGLGREKGRYGVEDYLEYKAIYLSYNAKL
ncbi:MAG: aldehyde dehydrogenase family protein [Roseiarcus sp.]